MAYQNSHVKVTIFGTSCNGAEEWSTGFRMGTADGGGGNSGIGVGWLDAVAPLWTTFFQTATVGIATMWKTTGIKASLILATGATDLDHVETYAYGTPISGGGSSNAFPPQCALVAQLAAASPIGLGAKGRMYLPGVSLNLQPEGGISTTNATNIANALRTFLDGCESATNSPGYVINASEGRTGVNPADPINRRVTQVRVGTIYDTQRRRRNGLQEVYSTAAMAA